MQAQFCGSKGSCRLPVSKNIKLRLKFFLQGSIQQASPLQAAVKRLSPQSKRTRKRLKLFVTLPIQEARNENGAGNHQPAIDISKTVPEDNIMALSVNTNVSALNTQRNL